MGYGLILFLLTGQAGYLYEAMLLIKNGKNKDELTLKTAPNLERYLVSLSTASQQDYEKVCSLLENGSNNADFKKYVENLRNRVAFHYDHGYRGTRTAPDTLVSEQAVIGLANFGLAGTWILPERNSNENERVLDHRFGFADMVIDYAIYRKVWGISNTKKGKDMSAEADRIVDLIIDWIDAYLGFASELCIRYFDGKQI